MLNLRAALRPYDVVIRVTLVSLAIVSGIGTAYFFWSHLPVAQSAGMVSTAVIVIGSGLGLLGFGLRRETARTFVFVAAATLVAAFFLGAGPFSALSA